MERLSMERRDTREETMGMNDKDVCPKFASCITPCVYGRRDYFFVKDVCLTSKDFESCTRYMGSDNEQGITPESASRVGEALSRCSRLEICLRKPNYGLGYPAMAPTPEYEEMVCRTQEHLKCLYYLTWWYSGRWPDDDMTSLEIKDGPSYKEAVIDRLKGEPDDLIPLLWQPRKPIRNF
jgi:hypothetical protein